MPYIYRTGNNKLRKTGYNVEKAVGVNSPNQTDDVKLVQFMLSKIYKAADLKVDGWIGPITNGYIRRFQEEMKPVSGQTRADGRVDSALMHPEQKGQLYRYSRVSQTIYTIHILNDELVKRDPTAFHQVPMVIRMNPNPSANRYNPVKPTDGNGPIVLDEMTVPIDDGMCYPETGG